MTPAEAQILLSMAATVDNRKPDEDAARAWAAMLNDLRFEDCREAVIAHYRVSTEWLMPSMVRAGVKAIRDNRIREFGPFEPPSDLDPADYSPWLGNMLRRIADGDTFDPEELAAIHARPRNMPDLEALLPRVE